MTETVPSSRELMALGIFREEDLAELDKMSSLVEEARQEWRPAEVKKVVHAKSFPGTGSPSWGNFLFFFRSFKADEDSIRGYGMINPYLTEKRVTVAMYGRPPDEVLGAIRKLFRRDLEKIA